MRIRSVEELVAAVRAGDEGAVRGILLAQPELINKDLSEGNEHRALHFAVLQRDVAMVRLLMEAGADARKGIWPHRDGTSAFVIARDREYGDVLAVIDEEERRRREELSCPNATVSPVQDQINEAIESGDDEAAMQLLATDLTLVQACDGQGATPLHVASREDNLSMAEWLLARRAKVNKRDVRNRSALDVAASEAMARLLVEHGAELSVSGAIVLGDAQRVRELVEADGSLLRQMNQHGGLVTEAVRHGRIEMVRLLLDLGADVDERVTLTNVTEPVASWGMPLWHAAMENKQEIAQLLLERGADANANVYASGWPLGNAWNHADGVIKKMLLEHGAKRQPYMVAQARDVKGARRLLDEDSSAELARELTWSAADHGCPAIVELAVARLPWRREDPQWHWILIQPIRGATPVDGHFECMEILLRHGVDANVARYGATALHFAAGYHGGVPDEDRARFAGMLIDAGASLTLRDDLLQSTPLGWACRWGRTKMAKILVERGAVVEEVDAEVWAQPKVWAAKRESGLL